MYHRAYDNTSGIPQAYHGHRPIAAKVFFFFFYARSARCKTKFSIRSHSTAPYTTADQCSRQWIYHGGVRRPVFFFYNFYHSDFVHGAVSGLAQNRPSPRYCISIIIIVCVFKFSLFPGRAPKNPIDDKSIILTSVRNARASLKTPRPKKKKINRNKNENIKNFLFVGLISSFTLSLTMLIIRIETRQSSTAVVYIRKYYYGYNYLNNEYIFYR